MVIKNIATLIILIILLSPALSTAPPQPIQKGGKLLVTQVLVTVTPESESGACPKKFVYTGRISASGTGQVTYRWVSSDNPMGIVQNTYFQRPGSKIIKLPKDYNASGSYWASLEIIAPTPMASNRATCRLTCIPVLIRPSFRISGQVNGGPDGRLLHRRKVDVILKQRGRTVVTRQLTLDANGTGNYEFGGPILFPGEYTLSVEKVATAPGTASELNVCFRGTTPPTRNVTLTNSSPTAANQDFTINFVIAWDSPPCW